MSQRVLTLKHTSHAYDSDTKNLKITGHGILSKVTIKFR